MVSRDSDYEPTHDAFGTDLERVRQMLALGYGETMIGECLGITTNRARYAIIVATNDRQGAPTLEEIAARCEAIQSGWTEEQAESAKHGDRRNSSGVSAPGNLTFAERSNLCRTAKRRLVEERIAAGAVNVVFREGVNSPLKWWSRPRVRDKAGSRLFSTREEALAWGREWMLRQAEEEGDPLAFIPNRLPRFNSRAPAEYATHLLQRVASTKPSVRLMPSGSWKCNVSIRGRHGSKRFRTREEAFAWGREWMVAEARRQAEACGVELKKEIEA